MYFTSQELYYNHNRTTNITHSDIIIIVNVRNHCCAAFRVRLKLLGALGWNLERGPISNEKKGEKHIIL